MQGERLKPCPFCGGEPIPMQQLREGFNDGEPDAYAHYVVCRSCAAEGPWAKNETGARRLWNTRTEVAG